MSNNKLLLTIAGLSILINTNEDESYTRELADELDRDINAILGVNSGASVTNAALLCAIDYLDSAKKSAKNANNMRNQVKDYMDDAAKTKFKFDEEHKRANELALEIQSLRSHLTRLATEGDSTGVVQNIKAELASAQSDLQELRDKAGKIAAANKSLNEKSAAMSDYIAGQDKEITRLSSIVSELNKTISKKDEQLSALAARIESLNGENRSLKSENARLNTDLYTLEQSMNEDRVKARELSAQLADLRLEIEASKNGNGPAGRFDPAIPEDSVEQAPAGSENRPILFDYDAPYETQDVQLTANGVRAEEEADDVQQMTFEDSMPQDSGLQEQQPVLFESFQVSDSYSPSPSEDSAADAKQEESFEVLPGDSDGLPDLHWTLEV